MNALTKHVWLDVKCHTGGHEMNYLLPGTIQSVAHSQATRWERKEIVCFGKNQVYQMFIDDDFFFSLLRCKDID